MVPALSEYAEYEAMWRAGVGEPPRQGSTEFLGARDYQFTDITGMSLSSFTAPVYAFDYIELAAESPFLTETTYTDIGVGCYYNGIQNYFFVKLATPATIS